MTKVMHIGFGYEPFWSGGMVIYQMDMIKELQNTGFDVFFFIAGRYDLNKNHPHLTKKVINGVKCIELVNSPNPYDPYCYRTNPINHCHEKAIEMMIEKAVLEEKPDVVHLHDIRMYSASIIETISRHKIPIIKTIHDFWDLCPRGDLLYMDNNICVDFRDGENCLKCLNKYSKDSVPLINLIKGTIDSKPIISTINFLINKIKIFYSPGNRGNKSMSIQYTAKDYKFRREYFIEMLNLCDFIHTTSNYCREKLMSYGINDKIIKTIPLSTGLLSQIKPKPIYIPHYPINFGYRGAIHSKKGIHTLLAAFSNIDQNKGRLIIYGEGDENILKQYYISRLNIEYRGKYSTKSIADSLDDIDVGIVPSIWEEPFGMVGLEYINARIPVIASNTGGIKEWLKNNENGFLFKPGDVKELEKIIQSIINKPEIIVHLQNRIKPWKTSGDHAKEIGCLYQNLLKNKKY